jgi:hypothetical protein
MFTPLFYIGYDYFELHQDEKSGVLATLWKFGFYVDVSIMVLSWEYLRHAAKGKNPNDKEIAKLILVLLLFLLLLDFPVLLYGIFHNL